MASVLAKLGLDPSPTSRNPSHRFESLPLYSPVSANDFSSSSSSSLYRLDESDRDPADETRDDQLRSHGPSAGRLPVPSSSHAPPPSRFLADFTLGFADGLTVPFALTAGLSSLGQTDTVIYAGIAEICAGCISMGIGGYLSARGEARADSEAPRRGGAADAAEKGGADAEDAAVASYLALLDLTPQLQRAVATHVRDRPAIGQTLLRRAAPDGDGEETTRPATSTVVVGLSVALGYLLGGLLPLFPYFFVARVGDGLAWSFAVCVLALFGFGFGKDFALRRQRGARRLSEAVAFPDRKGSVPWRDLAGSTWEGVQMVLLGGTAALAAVACVRVFEGMGVDSAGKEP